MDAKQLHHRLTFTSLKRVVASTVLAALAMNTLLIEGRLTLPAPVRDLFRLEQVHAAVGINKIINYQGKVSAINGSAIGNGSYNMRFRIYDAATGGNLLWTEEWTNATTRATMTGGLFTVGLGTHVTMDGAVNFNTDNLYLQIEFDPGNDGTFEEVFSPRRKFGSVPYAFNTDTLDGLDSTEFLRKNQDNTMTGSITINNDTGLTVRGAISGALIHASGNLTTSGSLIVEGDVTLKNYTSCAVITTDGSGNLGCGESTTNTGSIIAIGDGRYVKKSGDTMTGTLVLAPVSGLALNARGTISGALVTQNGAGNNYFMGNVGIGTTSPGAKLDIYFKTGDALNIDWDVNGDGTLIKEMLKINQYAWQSDYAASSPYIRVQNPSLSAPTYAFSGDINTGITRGGEDILQLVTGGSERLRINSFGNVGIGTTAPKTKLDVAGSISGASLYISSSMSGAGLTDCDLTNKSLQWDATTERFSCATISGITNTGAVITIGDRRYVKKQGDTMTGALVIRPTAGTGIVGLNVAATMSGRSLYISGTGASPLISTNVTTGRIGIGTSEPSFRLEAATDQAVNIIGSTGYGAGSYGEFVGRAARGTQASPSAVTLDDVLSAFSARGHNGSSFVTGDRARISMHAGENWAGGNNATYMSFSTTPGASSTLTERMRILSTGQINLSGNGVLNNNGASTFILRNGDSNSQIAIGPGSGTTYQAYLHTFNETSVGEIFNIDGGTTIFNRNGNVGAGTKILQIRGSSAQTANLQEWQNSTGTAELYIKPNGTIYSNTDNNANENALEGAKLGIYGSTWVTIESAGGLNFVTNSISTSQSSTNWYMGNQSLSFSTPSGELLQFNGNSVVINEDSADIDFRVEGNTDASLLFTNGGTDRVGIGTTAPKAKLDVAGSISGASLYISSSMSGAGLTDCDLTNKSLQWDATTERFSCATISGITNTGAVITIGDSRYVKRQGDTMTGALVISMNANYAVGSGALAVTNNKEFSTGAYIYSSGTVLALDTDNRFGASKHILFGYRGVFDTNLYRSNVSTLKTDGSLYVMAHLSGATFGGAGLTDCDASTQKLQWDASTNTFSCGTISTGTNTGAVITIGDSRYVKKQGDTMTGTLVINPATGYALNARGTISGALITQNGAGNNYFMGNVGIGKTSPASALDVSGTIIGRGAVALQAYDEQNQPSVRIGAHDSTGDTGAHFQTAQNLWFKPGTLRSNFGIFGINLQGSGGESIFEIGSDSNNYELAGTYESHFKVLGNSGNVGIGTGTPKAKLDVAGSISGASLYISSSMSGAGLTDCDLTNKSLQWDATTERFSCATISGITNTGAVITIGDSRYVKKQGDTMTGALVINVTGGSNTTLGLNVLNTISGAVIRAQKALASSGTLAVEGDANIDGSTFYVDSANNRVGMGTTSPVSALNIAQYQNTAFTIESLIGGLNNGEEIGSIQWKSNDSTLVEPTYGNPDGIAAKITALAEADYGRDNALAFYTASYYGGSGLTEKVRITHSGNMGIGTTSPDAKLDVIGTISGALITQNGAGNNYFRGNVGIGTTAPKAKLDVIGTISGALITQNGAGNNYFMGNVGIGTTSPSAKLDVQGAVRITLPTSGTALSTTATSGYSTIDVGGSSNVGGYIRLLKGTTAAWAVSNQIATDKLSMFSYVLNDSVMTMLNTGNVGIGTSSPNTKLEVAGSISGATLYITSSMSGAGLTDCDLTNKSLQWDATTERFSCATISGITNTGAVITIGDSRYVKKQGDTMTGALVINITGGSNTTLGLNVLNTISGAVIRAQKALASSGTLAVNGTSMLKGVVSVGGEGGTADLISGTALFRVRAAAGGRTMTFSNAGGLSVQEGGVTMRILPDHASGRGLIGTYENVALGFITNNTVRMSITSTGSVGIGTATPKAKLDVIGTISGALITQNGAGNNYFMGNVGIGTTSPSSALQVVGAITAGPNGTATLTNDGNGALLQNLAGGAIALKVVSGWALYSDNSLKVHIAGGAAGQGTLQVSDGPAASMVITATGLVGIGTPTPKAKLEVAGSISGATLYISSSMSGAGLTDCDLTNKALQWDATTERFSCTTISGITNTGAVITIGDSRYVKKQGDTMTGTLVINPATGYALNARGTISGALITQNGAGNNYFRGNVGIGTISPAHKLDVTGTIHASATLASSGTLVAEGMTTLAAGNVTIAANGATIFNVNRGDVDFLIKGVGNANLFFADASTDRIGIGTNSPSTALHVVGDLRLTNLETYSLSRTLPTTINNVVDIGTFTLNSGAGALRISVVMPASGFSVTKEYLIPISYGEAPSWVTVQPIGDTGAYSGNDFELDVQVSGATASLRLRRTGGSTGGLTYITIKEEGALATSTFVESSATGSVTAPTAFYSATALRQLGGNVGIGTAAPKAKLDVVGTISGSLITQNGAGTNYFMGNVGIGTTSPDGLLGLYKNSTLTSSKTDIAVLSHSTTGTPANGFGSRMLFKDSITAGGAPVSAAALASERYSNRPSLVFQVGYNYNDVSDAFRMRRAQEGGTPAIFEGVDSTARIENIAIFQTAGTSGGFYVGGTHAKLTANSTWIPALSGYYGVEFNNSNAGTVPIKFDWLNNKATFSNLNVGIGTTTPKAKLDVAGSISGATLYISSSMSGAGLTDCDLTNKSLQWDATTERFSCATISGITNTGAVITIGDSRYVKKQGDTMTGTLVINPATGYALNARGTISGALITQNGAGSNYFMGNVGIGTTLPSSALHVVGTITLDSGGAAGSATLTRSSTNYTQISGHMGAQYGFWVRAQNQTLGIDGSVGGTSGLGLYAGGTEKMTVLNTGNVGIGSTSPKAKLDVVGTISGALITQNGAGSNYFMGNVGIGTTNPGQKLSIQAASGNAVNMALRNVDGTALLTLETVAGSAAHITSYSSMNLVTQNNGVMSFKPGGSTMLDMNPGTSVSSFTGNVGIGISSPRTKLEVNGSMSGASLFISSSMSGAGLTDCDLTNKSLQWDATTERFSCATISGITNTGAVITIGDSRYVKKQGDTMTGTLVINPATGYALNARGTISGALITQNGAGSNYFMGKVGIGTTSPTYDLQIGKITTGSEPNRTLALAGYDTNVIEFNHHNGWTKNRIRSVLNGGMHIDADGSNNSALQLTLNDNPLLHLYGSSTTRGIHLSPSSLSTGVRIVNNSNYGGLNIDTYYSAASYQTFNLASTSTYGSFGLTSNVPLRFKTNGTDYMTLDTSGNLGIGTTAPKAKLDVVGTISGALITQNGAGSNYFMGNVGIGTVSPGDALHVKGESIRIENSYPKIRSTANNLTLYTSTSNARLQIGSTYMTLYGGVGTQTMYLEGSKVGIGTTAPASALHVVNATKRGSGALIVDQQAEFGTGAYIYASGASVLALDTHNRFGDSKHILFGYQGVFDTNLYRSDVSTLKTDGSLYVMAHLSGATFGGAGLTDCDASSQKLQWDATTKKFSCGTVTASVSTGAVIAIGDTRYVKKQGDTMTGALVINVTGGSNTTLGLNVLNTISGAVIRAQKALASSGTLAVEGDANIDGSTFYVDSTNNRIGIGTTSPLSTAALHVARAGHVYVSNNYGFFSVNSAGTGFGAGFDTTPEDELILYGNEQPVAYADYNSYGQFGVGISPVAGSARLTVKGAGTTTAKTFQLLDNASSNIMTVLDSGNVGIGTESPKAKLDVVGTISGALITQNGAGNNYFRGNVGIGTISPSANLEVEFSNANAMNGGQIDKGIFIHNTAGAVTDAGGGIWFRQGNTSGTGSLAGIVGQADSTDTNASALAFYTNDGGATPQQRMYIDKEGNVSIGGEDSSYAFSVLSNGGTALFYINSEEQTEINPDGEPSIRFTSDTSEYFTFGIVDGDDGFHLSNSSTLGTNTALFVSNNTRNIGIGTTSPDAKLDVAGTISGALITQNGAGNNYFMGNVGIGTTSPNHALEITGSAQPTIALRNSTWTAGQENRLLFYHGSTSSFNTSAEIRSYLPGANDTDLRFYTSNNSTLNSTPVLTLTGNEGVGIGVTNPQNKLDIEGAAVIGASYAGTNTAPANGLLVQGNVGIGTTAPKAKLDVAGSISGASLYISSSMSGAGLTDCDLSTQKLQWDATTERFSCGTLSAGTNTGAVLAIGDSRYVKKQGDTMTGALVINVTGGNINTLGLKIINTLSGAHLHAEKLLTSSGNLIVEGAIIGSAGSAAAPSMTFSTDSDSGIYSIANNQIGLAAGGTLGLQLYGWDHVLMPGGNIWLGTYGTQGFAKVGGGVINVLVEGSKLAAQFGSSVPTTIYGTTASVTAFVVKSPAGHTANLQEWQNSAGTALSFITPSGSGSFKSIAIGKTPVNGRPFEVVGTISGSLITQNGAGNNYFMGNVGIGTTAPQQKMDIRGTLQVSDGDWGVGSTSGFKFDSANKQLLAQYGAYTSTLSFGAADIDWDIGGHTGLNFSDGDFTIAGPNTTTYLAGTARAFNVIGNAQGDEEIVAKFANRGYTANTKSTIEFTNSNSVGLFTVNSNISNRTLDATSGSEDSSLEFYTTVAGTLAERMRIGVNGYVGIGTTAPKTRLDVVGTISGSALTISSLKSCDTIDTDANGNFVCGTDNGGTSGLSMTDGDARYVNTSGDTMTGALVINVTGGNNSTLGLNVLNTISGAVIRAQKALASSGTLAVEGITNLNGNLIIGDASADTVTVNSNAWTFANDTNIALTGGVNGLSFDTDTLSINALNNRVGIGTTSPAAALSIGNGSNALVGDGTTTGSTLGLNLSIDDNGDYAMAIENTNTYGRGLLVKAGTSAGNTEALTIQKGDITAFTVATSSVVTLPQSSAMLGIGTSSPATILSVGSDSNTEASDGTYSVGGMNIRVGIGGSEYVAGIENTDQYGHGLLVKTTGSIGTKYLAKFQNGTSDRMVIMNSGDVGIGTTAPKAKLDVIGTISGSTIHAADLSNCNGNNTVKADADGTLYCATDEGGGGSSSKWTDGGAITYLTSTSDDLAIGGSSAAAPFFFDTSASLLAVTNVDVSGATELNTLDVSGATTLQSGTITLSSFASCTLKTDASGNITCGTDMDTNTTYTANNGLTLNGTIMELGGTLNRNTTVTQAGFNMIFNLSGTGNFEIQDAGTTAFKVLDTGDIQLGNNNEIYVDTSAGNVGIGITNPTSKFHVNGVSQFDSHIKITNGNQSTSDSNNQILMSYPGGQYTHAIKTRHASNGGTDNAIEFYVWSGADAAGDVATTNVMTLSTGKVGIGTTDPKAKLDVVGTISGSALTISSLRNCDTIDTDANGNFICGTDSSAASGMGIAEADARYVQKQGDTMTGALVINITGGNNNTLGLNVLNTISGAVIRAQKALASSGTLAVEGITTLNGTLNVAGATTLQSGTITLSSFANCTLKTDGSGNMTCGTDTDTNTTYTAGTGLNLSGTQFTLSHLGLQNLSDPNADRVMFWDDSAGASAWLTMGTNLSIVGTTLNATDTNTTYTANNGLTLNGTVMELGGTLNRNTTVTQGVYNLLYNLSSTGDFEIQDAGTTAFKVLDTGDIQLGNNNEIYVDTSAGSVGIGTVAPKAKLDVIGTMSGSRVYASTALTTSGVLVIESLSKTGSGAATIVGAEFQTGAYVFGSGAPVLALDSYGPGRGAKHILFGYKGNFDTSIYRHNDPGISIKAETNQSTDNVLRVMSNNGSTDNTVFRVQANGQVFSDGAYASTGADYAEWFYAGNQKLLPGEVVCIDVTRNNAVKRCERNADSNIMGIVSTNPAFIGNSIGGASGIMPPGYALVGLIGQVPAKVTSEGGEIRPGDSLTAASKAGFARKASPGDSTVGVALEGMKDSEGIVNVLISRRNQSLTVEAVEENVLKTIASMEIDDEVQLMVSSALGDLNVDAQISTEVERQLAGMQTQQQTIEAIQSELQMLKEELSRIKSMTGTVQTSVISDQPAADSSLLTASSLELDQTLVTGGDARIGGDLHIDGTITASSLFVPNGLSVDGGMVMNGLLDTAELRVSSGAVIDGMLRVNGGMAFSSGSFLDLREASVYIADLIVENSLFVMGDVTIEGLAKFFGDVEIHGELRVSTRQAGSITIPAGSTKISVDFGTGFTATPVVTATSNDFIYSAWRVKPVTQTGFTIELAQSQDEEVTFSWIALVNIQDQEPLTGQVVDGNSTIFPLDSRNIPVSSNMAWNACIRNIPMFDSEGKPLSCSRYHDAYTWMHPDLGISFIWNTSMTPAYLKVPDGYKPTVTESAASVEGAITPDKEIIEEEVSEEEVPATDTDDTEEVTVTPVEDTDEQFGPEQPAASTGTAAPVTTTQPAAEPAPAPAAEEPAPAPETTEPAPTEPAPAPAPTTEPAPATTEPVPAPATTTQTAPAPAPITTTSEPAPAPATTEPATGTNQ